MPEQWWNSLTTAGWRFQEVLDGTKKDPPNPTYTCMVKMTPRGQYITWKNALREEIGTSEQLMPRRKSHEIKNLACFDDKLIVIFMLTYLEMLSWIVFSFEVSLVLWHPHSTNLLFGPLAFELNTSLGSLQIESLQFAPSVGRAWFKSKEIRFNVHDGGSRSTSLRSRTTLGRCQPTPSRVKRFSAW